MRFDTICLLLLSSAASAVPLDVHAWDTAVVISNSRVQASSPSLIHINTKRTFSQESIKAAAAVRSAQSVVDNARTRLDLATRTGTRSEINAAANYLENMKSKLEKALERDKILNPDKYRPEPYPEEDY